MLAHLLGLVTVVCIALAGVGTLGAMWLALYRPWYFRRRVPVPREVDALMWVVPDQDNPFPWI